MRPFSESLENSHSDDVKIYIVERYSDAATDYFVDLTQKLFCRLSELQESVSASEKKISSAAYVRLFPVETTRRSEN